MKKIVVGDVEAIRTCVRRRRNEDKVAKLTNRNGVAEAGGGGGVGGGGGAGGGGGGLGWCGELEGEEGEGWICQPFTVKRVRI